MTVEIKGYGIPYDRTESVLCDYNDVTIIEKVRKGLNFREIRVQPQGVKRARVFSDAVYSSITMQEATTGKKMLDWQR